MLKMFGAALARMKPPIPTATTLGTGTQPDQHGNKYSLKNAHKKDKLCI